MELIQQIAWSIFGIGVFLVAARGFVALGAWQEKHRRDDKKETRPIKAENPILGYQPLSYPPPRDSAWPMVTESVNVMDTIRLAQAPNWTEYNELMSKIKRRDEKKKESLDGNSVEAIKLDPLSRFDDLD